MSRLRIIIDFIFVYAYLYLFFVFVIYRGGVGIYYITPSLWNSVDATVIEIESVSGGRLRGTNEEVKSFKLAKIEYYNENQIYHSNVPVSYKEKVGDIIDVAVKKDDYKICIRKEWLPFSKGEIIINAIMIVIALGAFICLCKKKRNEHKQNKVISIT